MNGYVFVEHVFEKCSEGLLSSLTLQLEDCLRLLYGINARSNLTTIAFDASLLLYHVRGVPKGPISIKPLVLINFIELGIASRIFFVWR